MKMELLSDSNGTENYVSGASNMANIIAARFGFTKVNSSVSGNDVDDMIARVSADVLAHSPDVLAIMAGTNDGARAFENGIPEATWTAAYLSAMADLIDAVASVPYIIVASPPPARITRLCNEWPGAVIGLKALCATKGVHYAPNYEAFAATGIIQLNATSVSPLFRAEPDKYHLDTGGHALSAQVIGDAIEAAFNAGCVWNSAQAGTGLFYTEGNLSIQQTSGTTGGSAICTQGKSSGKHYFELTYATPASATSALVGVTRGAYNTIKNLTTTGADDYWYDSAGRLATNGGAAASGQTAWDTSGNTVGVKVDLDNMVLDFIDRNGATIAGFSGLPAGTYYPIAGIMSGAANANLVTVNFTGAFVHTVPLGFSAFGA